MHNLTQFNFFNLVFFLLHNAATRAEMNHPAALGTPELTYQTYLRGLRAKKKIHDPPPSQDPPSRSPLQDPPQDPFEFRIFPWIFRIPLDDSFNSCCMSTLQSV
jgi:hypothetical protein